MSEVMAWDAYIEQESEFVVLPEGDYEFRVTKFERAWFEGSAKVAPCNKAELELKFTADGIGSTTVKENLLLSKTTEWKLCEFFRCIGQKVHGTGVKMNWDAVLGAIGKAHLYVDEWQGNDGNTKKNNKVKYYIDAETGAEPKEELPWG